MATAFDECPGCAARLASCPGPAHPYVAASPECWRVFGEVQADESLRFGYPAAHRIVVDTYMAQHPGDGSDRRDRQSVFAHLIGLCAVLELEQAPWQATAALRAALRGRREFPRLPTR